MDDTQASRSPSSGAQDEDARPKPAAQARVRRRNRMITSCLECRRRKLKCDKQNPCTNCDKFSRECTFLAPALDSVSQQKLNEIKDKMGSLERVLEEDVAKRGTGTITIKKERKTSIDLPGEDSSGEDTPPAAYEKEIEQTPLAVGDAAYEDDANDDVLDLGVRIGKMRMGERLGGFVRPKFSEELAIALANPETDRRTDEEKAYIGIPPLADNQNDFLEPGSTFINPGSGFMFGDVGTRRELIDYLPTKDVADRLIDKYYENVHFVARVLHWPSFQLLYDNFWTTVLAGYEPQASAQAVVLSVIFGAIASMSDEEIMPIFGQTKAVAQANFQKGTEVCLSKAQFLRATKIETLQAFVIYLIPMCRDQLSRAHSVLVGTAIRLGECMGLHRDPKDVYNFPPVECHTRRILWFQLLFLDYRTGEGHGPRPTVKREDFDTRFPLNIDDADLMSGRVEESNTRFTDMTLSRARFECNEMQRIVWYDRVRLEKKAVSLTHVLGKIEAFRKAMIAKYQPMFDRSIPIQRYAYFAMTVLLNRLHIMILHRYLNHVVKGLPESLIQLIITTGTAQLESAVVLETDPDLAKWRWYNGVYQQWHAAFLLHYEINKRPDRKEADRLWKVFDFVFEPDTSLSRTQKARSIIAAVKDRGAVYRDIRRLRAPGNLRAETVRKIWGSKSPTDESKPLNAFQQTNSPSVPSNPILQQQQTYPTADPMSASALNTSWTMDTMAPRFWSKKLDRPQEGANNDASSSSDINTTTNNNTAHYNYQQQDTTHLPNNRAPSIPGLSYSSPSEASATDPNHWPPLISAEQSGWLPIQSLQTPPQQQSNGMQISNAAAGGYGQFQQQAFFPQQQQGTMQSPGMAMQGQGLMSGGGVQGRAGPSSSTGSMGEDVTMPDIDWGEWDKIFPPGQDGGGDGGLYRD